MSNRRKVRAAPSDTLVDLLHRVHPRPTVVVSYCCPGEVAQEFCESLSALLIYDATRDRHVVCPGGGTIALRSGPRIAEARSQLVDNFLTLEVHRSADWLLMVDADMDFDPDLVDRLLAYADPREVPVVGALCIAGNPTTRQYPTVYDASNDDDGYLTIDPVALGGLPDTGLVKVGATGAACLLVHRWVWKAVLDRYRTLADGRPNPYPWFVEGLVTSKGHPLGEDIAFCRKLMLMGIPVHVAMDVEVRHRKWTLMDRASCLAFEAREAVERDGLLPSSSYVEVDA